MRKIVLACATLMWLAAGSATAQIAWVGGTGDFLDGSNWQGGAVPTFLDDAIINNGGTAQVTAGDPNVFGLTLGSAAGTSGNLEVSGGRLFVDGAGEFGEVGTGAVTITGGELLVGSSSIFVGGRGDFTGATGTGTMTVNGATAIVDSQDDFQLGRTGTGTLNLMAGQVAGFFTVVGKFGTGIWNQSGGLFVAKNDLEVGDGGRPDQAGIPGPRQGEINLTGGVLHADNLFIGNRSGAGVVNVSGTGFLSVAENSSGSIVVGRGADWSGQIGAGGDTELRVTGGDAIVIANNGFQMNPGQVATSSTLIAEITGPTHTTIKIGGDANLTNGTFRVELNGYTPQSGDSWVILEAGADLTAEIAAIDAYVAGQSYSPLTFPAQSVGGTLASTTFAVTDLSAALPAGLSWDLSYTTNTVVLSVTGTGITCDLDGSGSCGIEDIDALIMGIANGSSDPALDLNGDGSVDLGDRDEWLSLAGAQNNSSGNPYLLGDADLSGAVDVTDFNRWNSNKFTAEDRWSTGDFNADGFVDVSDFNIWNGSKFQSSDGVAAVPEPASFFLLLLTTCAWVAAVRRR